MRFLLGVKKWHISFASGFLAAIGINYVTSELRENSELRRDLKAAEMAREVTVNALQKREQSLDSERQKTKKIDKVISSNAYENRALSPLVRAYVDGLH